MSYKTSGSLSLLNVHNKLYTQTLQGRENRRSAVDHFSEEVKEFIEAEEATEIVLEAGDVIYTLLRLANEKLADLGCPEKLTVETILRHNIKKLSKVRK